MKKILNIFASISLITAGTSNVLACGDPTKNDQQIVNDINSHLKNKTFGVDENINGYQNFTYYRSKILEDIQSKLTEQEKDLVSLPSNDNTKTLNAKEPTAIQVDIQSHNVSGYVDVYVKLNNDAQSIADKLDTKTITVYKPLQGPPDKYHSFTLSPISAYQSQIETQINQLLTSEGVKINYGIHFIWNDPKTQLIDNLSWVHNAIVGLNINVGQDIFKKTVYIQVKLAFDPNYTQAKADIDNPKDGSYTDPKQVDTGGQTVKKDDWDNYNIDNKLSAAWAFEGFSQYVSYVPNKLIYGEEYNPQTKQKEKIKNQVTMYCPLLGYTKGDPAKKIIANPRTFYVVVN